MAFNMSVLGGIFMASNSILVIGGGFSGLTAALEAAELGHEVFIVEKTPFLSGRVMQLNKIFSQAVPAFMRPGPIGADQPGFGLLII